MCVWCCRMKAGQKSIFYMASDSLEVARSAPFVEKLIKKGYEVRVCLFVCGGGGQLSHRKAV